MRQIIFILTFLFLIGKVSAWTSSNEGVCYTMDTICLLSPYIIYNSNTGMYELDTHITILENDTLKLNPGEILKFVKLYYPFWGLRIYGNIIAIGTKDSPIILGDPEYDISNGFIWNGIQFYDTSPNGESILKYCTIRGGICLYNCGPGGESAIYCENSSPIIDHCRICYMISGEETGGGSGVSCEGQSYPIIANCTFDHLVWSIAIWCNPWGIYQDTINYPSPLILNCNIRKSVSGFYYSPLDYDVVVYWGGFLDNCYLGVPFSNTADTTLGIPIDTIGDGVCNTTSTNYLKRFMDVDGVKNPRGDTLLTGINEEETNILPTTSQYLVLKHNYPNPFSSFTTIEFEVTSQQALINLYIYDSKGNCIKQLITNSKYTTGTHQIKWNADNEDGNKVNPGIYFYKLLNNDQLQVKKAIVVKN